MFPRPCASELKIIPITHMDQVIDLALAPEPTIEPPRPRKRNEEHSTEESPNDNSPGEG